MQNLNSSMEHLAFDVNKQHIWVIHLDLQTHVVSYVTKEVYATTIMRVETKCASLTLTLTSSFFHIIYLEFGRVEFDLH
jgi:hypothetical protein